MQTHQTVYFNHFGISHGEPYYCEICERHATGGIHHIEARGMGSKQTTKAGEDINGIENLMALCDDEHKEFGDKEQYLDYLKKIRKLRLQIYATQKIRPGEKACISISDLL